MQTRPQTTPDLPTLIARLQELDRELAGLSEDLSTELSAPDLAGTLAHQALLLRKRKWYLARIRALKPVEVLGVDCSESVTTGEAL